MNPKKKVIFQFQAAKLKPGYSLLSMVIYITLISASIGLFAGGFMIWQKQTYYHLKKSRDIETILSVQKELLEYFTEDTKENFTSPFQGWYSEIPEKIREVEIRVEPEDSKIDINHLPSWLLPGSVQSAQTGAVQSEASSDEVLYYYHPDDFFGENKDLTADEWNEILTVYAVPSLNTADLKKLEIWCESRRLPGEFFKSLEPELKKYRQTKDYMKKKGLDITEQKFEILKNLVPKEFMDLYPVYFDYRGTLNLNLVQEKAFKTGLTMIGINDPSKSASLWNRVTTFREAGNTVKKIEEIFSQDKEIALKLFSADSYLFRVTLTCRTGEVILLIRRVRDFKGALQAKIIRSFYRNNNEKS
jgi:hypothetical protein